MASLEAQEEKNTGEGYTRVQGGEEVKGREVVEEMAGEGEAEEKDVAAEDGKEGEGKKKRGRKPGKRKDEGAEKKSSAKRQAKEAKAFSDRPARERKTVERLSELSPPRVAVPKALSIQQGSGTKLKDIPNVFFKLSKRKIDENLHLLHTILFAKKAKALYLKRNIYQFSGFVWTVNEEKQRAKVKEKLDKCIKDKLLDFCDVLDIPVSGATTKKEEISAKLLEFLESPYVTRDIVLSERELKRKKRKSKSKGISKSTSGYGESDIETKKQKKEHEHSPEEKADNETGDSAAGKGASNDDQHDDDKAEENHDDKSESETQGDEQNDPSADKKDYVQKRTGKGSKSKVNSETSASRNGSPAKLSKITSRLLSKESSLGGRAKAPGKSWKGSSLEQMKEGPKTLTKKKAEPLKLKGRNKSQSYDELLSDKDKKKTQSASRLSASEHGKGKPSGKDKEPTRAELHAVVRDILKEVDFNTATLADILKQLGSHFSMDLVHRKYEVKSVIEEVIDDMTDDDEVEREEDNADDQE